jgi:predicted negative regulator of RcsB-dependent stress response
VETYQTEEQQVEAIKKFWSENGNSIIAGIVIGLSGYIGWGYYQDSKIAAQEAVSASYQQLIESTENNSLIATGEKFVGEHQGTAYSAFTGLAMAKEAADAKDWAKAGDYLTQVAANAPTAELKAIAQVRLARVLLQQGNYEQALATLAKAVPESFKASVEEIKGDVYLKQGEKIKAREAYQAAFEAGGEQGNPVLQIKLDDLAVSSDTSK